MVRLTPNGLSVRSRQRAISLVRSSGVGWVSAVMKPSAPALATAATSSARPTHCMPPCTIGGSTPTILVNRVFSMSALCFPAADVGAGFFLEGTFPVPKWFDVLIVTLRSGRPRRAACRLVEGGGNVAHADDASERE